MFDRSRSVRGDILRSWPLDAMQGIGESSFCYVMCIIRAKSDELSMNGVVIVCADTCRMKCEVDRTRLSCEVCRDAVCGEAWLKQAFSLLPQLVRHVVAQHEL